MPVRAPMFPRRNSTPPTAQRGQPILLRHRLARSPGRTGGAGRTGCAGRSLGDRGWVLRPRDFGIIRSPKRWAG
jgi:hypothetical protein